MQALVRPRQPRPRVPTMEWPRPMPRPGGWREGGSTPHSPPLTTPALPPSLPLGLMTQPRWQQWPRQQRGGQGWGCQCRCCNLSWEICLEFRRIPQLIQFRTFWTLEFSLEFIFPIVKYVPINSEDIFLVWNDLPPILPISWIGKYSRYICQWWVASNFDA